MAELILDRLCVSIGDAPLVQGASLRLAGGELVVILGPNGAGKSTLLRAAIGLAAPQSGESRLDGADVATLGPAARARLLAYLPQSRPLAWPSRVCDIVALGRFAHGGPLARPRGADREAIERALAACDLAHLAGRN
ncbi:MAG: ABC transporter ATP-binding protein, partial [Planctomycetes bacterium]|nr:ABC transporter ATP-binding protein [Planctomycetota bacterium]